MWSEGGWCVVRKICGEERYEAGISVVTSTFSSGDGPSLQVATGIWVGSHSQ